MGDLPGRGVTEQGPELLRSETVDSRAPLRCYGPMNPQRRRCTSDQTMDSATSE